jgi:hypothetical protein
MVRAVALWFLFDSANRAEVAPAPQTLGRRLAQTLRAWAPYLLFTVGFMVWRLFFLKLPNADPYKANTLYEFFQSPLETLHRTAWVALVDELQILFNSWTALLKIELVNTPPFADIAVTVGLAAALGVTVFLLLYQRKPAADQNSGAQTAGAQGADDERRWLRQAFILGLAAVLLGPVPAWITGRQVVFDFHSDRYAMPAMFGAALLFAVLIHWLAQKPVQRALLTGALVLVAVGLHLRVANDYRWIWTSQQRFFWQLSWRAPMITPDTALFFEEEPFPNQGLFSTSAALNLMYPQPEGQKNLAYWVYTLRPRYNHAPDSYEIKVQTTFRTLHFEGKTPNSLLLYNDPTYSDCVWVLSDRDVDNPYISDLTRAFLKISNLQRIEPQAPQPGYPPTDMIGKEPSHTSWCYYFEKADLARQQGDWAAVSDLADQAQAQGYRPNKSGSNSPYEWLPFIEGLGRTGRWDDALTLTQQSFQRDRNYQDMLCKLWTGSLKDGGDSSAQALKELGCTVKAQAK